MRGWGIAGGHDWPAKSMGGQPLVCHSSSSEKREAPATRAEAPQNSGAVQPSGCSSPAITHATKRVRLMVRCAWKGRRISHALPSFPAYGHAVV